MIRYIGTDPRKSVLMPRAISLRSRVLGNWQARFWRPVERGDPSAEFNQPQGDHLTGPEVGVGVFGDGVQLLIDVVEQSDDQIPCGHAALLSGERCYADQQGRGVCLHLLYAPSLRHVTSCCINRFQAASRIDMPM